MQKKAQKSSNDDLKSGDNGRVSSAKEHLHQNAALSKVREVDESSQLPELDTIELVCFVDVESRIAARGRLIVLAVSVHKRQRTDTLKQIPVFQIIIDSPHPHAAKTWVLRTRDFAWGATWMACAACAGLVFAGARAQNGSARIAMYNYSTLQMSMRVNKRWSQSEGRLGPSGQTYQRSMSKRNYGKGIPFGRVF